MGEAWCPATASQERNGTRGLSRRYKLQLTDDCIQTKNNLCCALPVDAGTQRQLLERCRAPALAASRCD